MTKEIGKADTKNPRPRPRPPPHTTWENGKADTRTRIPRPRPLPHTTQEAGEATRLASPSLAKPGVGVPNRPKAAGVGNPMNLRPRPPHRTMTKEIGKADTRTRITRLHQLPHTTQEAGEATPLSSPSLANERKPNVVVEVGIRINPEMPAIGLRDFVCKNSTKW